MGDAGRLGAYLTACREASGLSVDDVSAKTRVVPRLIRALEADRLGDLPASVYVRGFIRSYCEQVGVTPEEALDLYEAVVRTERLTAWAVAPIAVVPLAKAIPVTRLSGRPRRRPLAVGAAAAVLVVALLGVALYQVGAVWRPHAIAPSEPISSAAVRNPAAAPSEAPAPAAVPAPSAPDGVATPEASPSPAPTSGPVSPRVLVIRADDTTWVRVKPEDESATQATLEPGAVREWRSTGRFTVTLGNAGGVRLELDGKALPALGTRGEVVRDVVIPAEPGGSGESGS